MKHHLLPVMCVLVAIITGTIYLPVSKAAENTSIIPCIPGKSFCNKCHHVNGISIDEKDLTRSCDHACAECHKNLDTHHKVGMQIEFPVNSTLRLGNENRLICITCHDLRFPRYSDTARKAQSLFGRIFNSEKQYKTYYLAMDNRKGQLCKICHY